MLLPAPPDDCSSRRVSCSWPAATSSIFRRASASCIVSRFGQNLFGARSQVARKRQKAVDFRHSDEAPIAAVDRIVSATVQSCRRSIIILTIIRIAHVHAAEPPAKRREDAVPAVAAVGVIRMEPETAMDEATVEEWAVKCDPAVNADYAVANCEAGMRSEPAAAERAPGVKSAPSSD